MRYFIGSCRGSIALIIMLFLSGCTTLVSNTIQDYQDIRNATRGYVFEQVIDRIKARDACRRITNLQVDEMLREGKFDEARSLIKATYPHISSVDAIQSGDARDLLANINEPAQCASPP